MRTASFNIQLNYAQIRGIVNQLSDEDKLHLANELIADARRAKFSYFQRMFHRENSEELPSMKEILAEVDAVRQEHYEKRKRG